MANTLGDTYLLVLFLLFSVSFAYGAINNTVYKSLIQWNKP